jgi:ketosteroid isomerase-like protein
LGPTTKPFQRQTTSSADRRRWQALTLAGRRQRIAVIATREGTAMAHPNVEFAQAGMEAFAKGDVETMSSMYADNVVCHLQSSGILSGTYRGRDEIFALFARIAKETNGTFRLETQSFLGDDDQAVVISAISGQRGDQTFQTRQVAMYDIKDKKIVEIWFAAEDGAATERFWS